VAREIIAAAESRHPNFAPVTAAMARVSLGESLVRDLRLGEAEVVLRAACARPGPIDPRVQLLLGETLELQGRRSEALGAYRAASKAGDRDTRRRAETALAHPRPPEEIEALRLVGEARRLRESHEETRAMERYREAASLWPACREAAVAAADSALDAGRLDQARAAIGDDDSAGEEEPPWVAAWARLLRARLRDAGGDREGAVELYNDVFHHPLGRPELRRGAEAGLREPWRPAESAVEDRGR
jgi:tetratricopeptide (TPR) repeat protein